MLRRFNYTGRKKLMREDVPVGLTGAKPIWGFNANLDGLAQYGLPGDGRVFIEAYEQAAYMRFDFGTVGNLTSPPPENRQLTEFEGSDGIRFRVKVVDSSPDAKLLAEADGMLPLSPEEAEQNRLPLLPVRSYDLGQELWKIEFPEGTQDRPTLLVSKHIDDRTAFVRSPAFASLVMPSILREILMRIVVIDRYYELDDSENWRCKWLHFAQTILPATSIPKDDEEVAYEWVADVVSAFCDKNALLARFKEYEEESANGTNA